MHMVHQSIVQTQWIRPLSEKSSHNSIWRKCFQSKLGEYGIGMKKRNPTIQENIAQK